MDGHDVAALESAFEQARCLGESVVVHCVTRKGRGYQPAEQHEADQLHVVRPGGDGSQPAATGPSWTSVFAREIVEIATDRPDVVGVTAAMPHPVGLDLLARAYPSRVFDVGIAEQHAVASAAGMARGGMHPVVAIYATFLNRAFDQMLMDVALHRAGVTFVLDRAGITGDDGPSHNGMWDLSMLQLVPGLRIAAPRDAAQLRAQLWEAVAVRDCPTVVRFPKGNAGPDLAAIDRVGGMDVLARTGDRQAAPDVLVVSVGPMADVCLQVAHRLVRDGIASTVVDPRWVKPVDQELPGLAARHRLVVTVEDNLRVGGAGSMIAQALRDAGVTAPLRDFGIPHRFIEQGQRQRLLDEVGLRAPDICARVVATLAGLADGAMAR